MVPLFCWGHPSKSQDMVPEGVFAMPGPEVYTNTIFWMDFPSETGKSYNIYCSDKQILHPLRPGVRQIAKSIEAGTQSFIHDLTYPIQDNPTTYFYAVEAVDDTGKVERFQSTFEGTFNTAKGIPPLSLNPPIEFAADGILLEWYQSDIKPFCHCSIQRSHCPGNLC